MTKYKNETRKFGTLYPLAILSRSTLAAAFIVAALAAPVSVADEPKTDAERQKYLDLLRGTQRRLETEKLLNTPTTEPAYPSPYYEENPSALDRMRGNLKDRMDDARRTAPKPKTTTSSSAGSSGGSGAGGDTGSGGTGDGAQVESAEVTQCRAYLDTEKANAEKFPGYLDEPTDGGRVTKMAPDGEVMTTTAESRASVRQKIADCQAMILNSEELAALEANRAAACELKRSNLVTYGSDPAERENYDRVKVELATECPDVVVETCVDKYDALDASRSNLELHRQLLEVFQAECPKYGIETGSVVSMVGIPAPITLPAVWDTDIAPVRYVQPNGDIHYEGSYSYNEGTTFGGGRYLAIAGNENVASTCSELLSTLTSFRASAPGDWLGTNFFNLVFVDEEHMRVAAKAYQQEYNDHCRLP